MNDDVIRRNLHLARDLARAHKDSSEAVLAEVREDIADALRRVQEARERSGRARMARGMERGPTPASGLVVTEQRREKGDIRDEDHEIENGAKVRRSRARPPLWIGVLEPPQPGEPQRKPGGALDNCLSREEAVALARFVYGTFIGEGRLPSSNYSGVSSSSDPTRRMPFNDRERAFIAARQHIWKKVPDGSRRDLQFLCAWIAGGGKAPISVEEWARRYIGTSDARVANGAFKGSFKRLAEMVAEILLQYDTDLERKRMEKRQEEERLQLLRGNSIDPEKTSRKA